ncbi:sensor histidine kinase, partial [Clostridium neonatale]|uniref:sensor histidine kinase n=1 Tax=Clostridium neonatale TaxID=137838 RepID=UPI0024335054
EEIQKKIKQLKEQKNSKQRFIDNLTHEIRTPLTSIIGYSDLMMNKKVQDIDLIYKSFNNINREGKRILALTSNLVSLITLDKKSLKLNNYSLKEILYDVRNALNMKIIQYDVELLIKGDDIEVFSDKNLLTIL